MEFVHNIRFKENKTPSLSNGMAFGLLMALDELQKERVEENLLLKLINFELIL